MCKRIFCAAEMCAETIYLKKTSESKKSYTQVLKELGWEKKGCFGNSWVCPRCIQIYEKNIADNLVEY